jgi:hypothetical protein
MVVNPLTLMAGFSPDPAAPLAGAGTGTGGDTVGTAVDDTGVGAADDGTGKTGGGMTTDELGTDGGGEGGGITEEEGAHPTVTVVVTTENITEG